MHRVAVPTLDDLGEDGSLPITSFEKPRPGSTRMGAARTADSMPVGADSERFRECWQRLVVEPGWSRSGIAVADGSISKEGYSLAPDRQSGPGIFD